MSTKLARKNAEYRDHPNTPLTQKRNLFLCWLQYMYRCGRISKARYLGDEERIYRVTAIPPSRTWLYKAFYAMTAKVKTMGKRCMDQNKQSIIVIIILFIPLTALSSWRSHMPGSTRQTSRGCRRSLQYLPVNPPTHFYRIGTQRKRSPAVKGWRGRTGRKQALTRDCCSWMFWGFSMRQTTSQCLHHS